MGKRSLQQRLYLALGALLLIQIAGGVVSLLSVNAYRDNTRDLVEDTLPEIDALGRVKSEFDHMLFETMSVLITGEEAYAARRAQAASELRARLDELDDAAETALSNTVVESPLFDRLRASAEQTIAETERLVSGGGAVEPALLAEDLRILNERHQAFEAVFEETRSAVVDESALAVAATEGNPLLIPLMLSLLSVVLSALLLGLISRRVLRPIGRLQDVTDAVAGGNLDRRTNLGGADEIGELAGSFDAMVATIAEQQHALRERAAMLEQANAAQHRLLETVRALTVPAIPVGQGVLALPLLGALDGERLQHITSALLQRVTHDRAHTVILDVTGLVDVSGDMISQLLQIAQSVQLLGARCILTGMRPSLAIQAVEAHVDLGQLLVQPTLGEGLALALAQGGMESRTAYG